jgi:hypothetical protein
MITLTPDRLARQGMGSLQEIRFTKDLDGQCQDGSPFSGALHLTQEGGPRPGQAILYDGMGRRLSKDPIHSSVSYSP